MVVNAELHITTREAKLLKEVATVFRSSEDRLVPKLERVLRHLLDQTIIEMDLVLFFDALDEFDGRLDNISRFLKSLLSNSLGSKTRVKVCVSSRPWEPLKDQFLSYPGFALQEHTKHDIEEYVLGLLVASSIASQTILGLVPSILSRADGVFLWVKLATKELLETAALGPESALPDVSEQTLQKLPSDLFHFYEVLVERIKKPNRRRTFALLELLVRHNGPPYEAHEIRNAVLLSDCMTFDDALQTLASKSNAEGEADEERVRYDIHIWSGGLVEIKPRGGLLRLQMMHQTVVEFVMGLEFKRMVVGDLATILHGAMRRRRRSHKSVSW